MHFRSLSFVGLCWLLAACNGQQDANILHRGLDGDPESLDVHKVQSTEAGDILRDIGEGLVGYSADGQLIPAAASAWRISEDGREYRFTIRAGARWSNGDPLTAEDFVYTYRRMVDPETAALYTQSVEGVENARAILAGELPVTALGVVAEDKETLLFRLENPLPYFLSLLTHASMFPVHQPSIETHGDRYARPGNLVSNGAYRLTDWQVGSHVDLERNEHYHDNANTAIDRVRHHLISESGIQLNRYRAGELDLTSTIPGEMYQELMRERPDEVFVSPALGVYYYGFNLAVEPFRDNPKLRQALSMAIDRKAIVEIVGRGETAAYSWVPNGTANYNPQEYSWAGLDDAERLTRAREHFREAGYTVGEDIDISIHYNTGDAHRQIAVAVQAMWNDAFGFRAELINQDFLVLVDNIVEKQTSVFRLNWRPSYNDAHAFLTTVETDNPSNFTGYSNDNFDRLMQSASEQTDPDARRLYLEEAEQEFLSDYALMPLYVYVNKHMVAPHVEGWADNLPDYHYSKDLRLADRP